MFIALDTADHWEDKWLYRLKHEKRRYCYDLEFQVNFHTRIAKVDYVRGFGDYKPTGYELVEEALKQLNKSCFRIKKTNISELGGLAEAVFLYPSGCCLMREVDDHHLLRAIKDGYFQNIDSELKEISARKARGYIFGRDYKPVELNKENFIKIYNILLTKKAEKLRAEIREKKKRDREDRWSRFLERIGESGKNPQKQKNPFNKEKFPQLYKNYEYTHRYTL